VLVARPRHASGGAAPAGRTAVEAHRRPGQAVSVAPLGVNCVGLARLERSASTLPGRLGVAYQVPQRSIVQVRGSRGRGRTLGDDHEQRCLAIPGGSTMRRPRKGPLSGVATRVPTGEAEQVVLPDRRRPGSWTGGDHDPKPLSRRPRVPDGSPKCICAGQATYGTGTDEHERRRPLATVVKMVVDRDHPALRGPRMCRAPAGLGGVRVPEVEPVRSGMKAPVVRLAPARRVRVRVLRRRRQGRCKSR
jgi:hypothetical protein